MSEIIIGSYLKHLIPV